MKDKCAHCNENHPIFACLKFKKLSVNERREVVKQKSLCLLCLKAQHTAIECKYKKMCPQCNKRHNGLLHFGGKEERRNEKMPTKDAPKKAYIATTTEEVVCATAKEETNANTVLATALVKIKTKYGWSEVIRVLIDPGSMTSFITDRIVKYLDLKRQKNNIAGSVESAKTTVNIEISARYPTSFKANITAIVLNKLTTMLPNNDFDKNAVNDRAMKDLILADPKFNKSARIDMILGADINSEIILTGLIKPDRMLHRKPNWVG